jgi:hypothetical protein
MNPTKEQHQILRKSWEKCNGDTYNNYTSIRGRKHELYTKNPNSMRPKKARQVKSKVKSMLITFLNIKGIVHKEFIMAGQTGYLLFLLSFVNELRHHLLGQLIS